METPPKDALDAIEDIVYHQISMDQYPQYKGSSEYKQLCTKYAQKLEEKKQNGNSETCRVM